MLRTITSVIQNLPKDSSKEILAPKYIPKFQRYNVALAVESMKRHMTDEGWQIMLGLQSAGYNLHGFGIPAGFKPQGETDVKRILQQTDPSTLVLQDKREWDTSPKDFREQQAKFTNIESLASRPDIFKLTILKDAHQRPSYHRQSAEEINAHAWVTYYPTEIVKHVAGYIRPQHCVRTYHSLDSDIVPMTWEKEDACIVSGAVSSAYPFRKRLQSHIDKIPGGEFKKHPGYHRDGCNTPEYLKLLSRFKVAICTSSVYGYALRKIIEATACGCVVITDLPTDDVLPRIDGNLLRVSPEISFRHLGKLVLSIYQGYNLERQRYWAHQAETFYDYHAQGLKLAQDIETLRLNYVS